MIFGLLRDTRYADAERQSESAKKGGKKKFNHTPVLMLTLTSFLIPHCRLKTKV